MTARSALGAVGALFLASALAATATGTAAAAPSEGAGPDGGAFPGLRASSAASARAATASPAAGPARRVTTALPAPGTWAIGYSAVTRFVDDSARLDLIGPSGGVAATIASISTDDPMRVLDARYDGRFVVTGARVTVSGRLYTRYTIYDVAAGTQKVFSLPGEGRAYFTSTGLLTVEWPEDGPPRAALRDYTGRWQKTLPLSGWGDIEVSPGGTLLMEGTDSGLVLRRAGDGSRVRSIPAPTGLPTCTPLGLWGQGYVKMTCTKSTDPAFERGTAFAVSTTTGQRIQLTPAGYFNAWPTSSRRTVEKSLPDSSQIGSLSGSTFTPYLPTQESLQVGMGAHGSSMWIGDSGEGWVKRYDVATRNAVDVAGPGSAIGGFVVDARLIDTVN